MSCMDNDAAYEELAREVAQLRQAVAVLQEYVSKHENSLRASEGDDDEVTAMPSWMASHPSRNWGPNKV